MERGPAGEGPEATVEGNNGTVRDGGWWRWDFVLCLMVALIAAFLLPLDDADLPMHLRTGAWILDNGRVPVIEPFAWTRAGDPFYAYSWLPEVLYQLAWNAGGATALSALHALLLGVVVVATWDLARTARWSVWATRLIMSVHLVLWLMVQPATRPQLMLAIALPMTWAAAYRVASHATSGAPSRGMALPLALAALSGVLAVNAHLFYFLTLAPVVVLLAQRRVDWRAVAGFCAATVCGWLVTPYLAHLPGILRLNLGGNALVGPASPISELEGGFSVLMHAAIGTRVLVGGLLLLPILPYFGQRTWRERWWYGLAWLAGLGLYGLAVRGVLLWWLLALPLVAWALASIPLPSLPSTWRAVRVAWCISIVGLLVQASKARALAVTRAPLPHPSAESVEPAVRWLTCALAAHRGATVRGTTAFDYGSYLAWRVPQLSWSIDGRGIFPDSVARADARQELRVGPPLSPPWRSSAVVLLSASHATLHEIAREDGWQEVSLGATGHPRVALWVRRDIVRGASHCSAS